MALRPPRDVVQLRSGVRQQDGAQEKASSGQPSKAERQGDANPAPHERYVPHLYVSMKALDWRQRLGSPSMGLASLLRVAQGWWSKFGSGVKKQRPKGFEAGLDNLLTQFMLASA